MCKQRSPCDISNNDGSGSDGGLKRALASGKEDSSLWDTKAISSCHAKDRAVVVSPHVTLENKFAVLNNSTAYPRPEDAAAAAAPWFPAAAAAAAEFPVRTCMQAMSEESHMLKALLTFADLCRDTCITNKVFCA